MKIDMNKTYKTKSGIPVRVLCIDKDDGEYPVIALLTHDNGVVEVAVYTSEGKYSLTGWEEQFDLVEVVPFADLKIDDPVMVRETEEQEWTPRHYSGLNKENKPTVWACGCTSWSVGDEGVDPEDEKTVWKYFRKPNAIELKNE